MNTAEQFEPEFEIYPELIELPDGRPEVEPFDYELLPESIQGYVRDAAERMQCAPDFIAVTALCALAGVVGTKVRMRPKQLDDWAIVPNLWGALIGRPSSMKTPTMGEGLKPLFALQDIEREKHQANVSQYKIEQDLQELISKEAKRSAAAILKERGPEAAKAALSEASETAAYPVQKRYIANDTTVPKLGELLNENPTGLILVRDELSGWMAEMQTESKQADRAFYLECYNGDGSYTFDRIERGTIHIETACLSIIGGIQPSKIAPVVRGTLNGSSDDGLLQRFQLAIWPDHITPANYIDRRPDREERERFTHVYRKLAELEFDQEAGPKLYRFSEDAQELFIEWWEDSLVQINDDDLPPALESHLIKMKKTVPSLALIFALVEGVSDTVDKVSLCRAMAWSDYLLSHAKRIYGVVIHGDANSAKLIVKRFEKLGKEFTARDVIRKGWAGLTDQQSVESALMLLVDHGYLLEQAVPTGTHGGRPTTIFQWNPRVQ